MSGVYYENPVAELTVPGGASRVLALPYPTRVRLTRLNVVQTDDDAAVAFTVNLFSAAVDDTPAPDHQDDLWLVSPYGGIASNAAGVLVHFFDQVDTFFVNRDAEAFVQAHGEDTPSLIDTAAGRRIYLRLTNGGLGAATFRVILGSAAAQLP